MLPVPSLFLQIDPNAEPKHIVVNQPYSFPGAVVLPVEHQPFPKKESGIYAIPLPGGYQCGFNILLGSYSCAHSDDRFVDPPPPMICGLFVRRASSNSRQQPWHPLCTSILPASTSQWLTLSWSCVRMLTAREEISFQIRTVDDRAPPEPKAAPSGTAGPQAVVSNASRANLLRATASSQSQQYVEDDKVSIAIPIVQASLQMLHIAPPKREPKQINDFGPPHTNVPIHYNQFGHVRTPADKLAMKKRLRRKQKKKERQKALQQRERPEQQPGDETPGQLAPRKGRRKK